MNERSTNRRRVILGRAGLLSVGLPSVRLGSESCSPLLVAWALGLALAAFATPAAADEPLRVRDQNPLIRGIYLPLPAPTGAVAEGWQVTTGVQWTNTVNIDVAPDEQLFVDAESVELDLGVTRSAGEWRLRAGLPLVWRGAGTLDGFIDSWHDLFGLPDGNRPQVPRNQYDVRYSRAGRGTVVVADGTAIGDLHLEAGRVLAASERGELVGWVGAELPTGSESKSTGNGGVDVSGWFSGRVALGDRVDLSGQAGIVAPGGDGPVPAADVAGFGTLALGWRFGDAFTAIVQLDAHSSLADDTSLEFLEEAIVLTLGGRIRMQSGAAFEAGVSEDVLVDHSPDVVFRFGWRWPAFR
jgi:hypothetical protein